MYLLYDLIYVLVVCLGWPWLLLRRIRRGPGSLALGQRLGNVRSRPVAARCVWIHGVSLGEINATRTLVEQLRRRDPAIAIVVSATTATGLARARELYPKLIVFRFPLDFSLILRRVFERLRPTAIVLMELEVWPNLIELARARGVPVLIANGRVTNERSVRAFDRPLVRSVARRMFGQLAWVGAQDAAYADRFAALGVPRARIEITGSLKYDAAEISDYIRGQDELAAEMGVDTLRPLWVCGSTGPQEEDAILTAYVAVRREFPDLQLAIVPRRPERFDEVARLIAQRGFACRRRSAAPITPTVDAPAPTTQAAREPLVFLGDTLGELRKFYALAAIVFVGRTLVPLGGSDVMEVAGLAKPMIVGPHMENFAEAAELLRAAQGLYQLATAADLPDAVSGLLRDAVAAREMGLRARHAITSRRGATELTIRQIMRLLGT